MFRVFRSRFKNAHTSVVWILLARFAARGDLPPLTRADELRPGLESQSVAFDDSRGYLDDMRATNPSSLRDEFGDYRALFLTRGWNVFLCARVKLRICRIRTPEEISPDI